MAGVARQRYDVDPAQLTFGPCTSLALKWLEHWSSATEREGRKNGRIGGEVERALVAGGWATDSQLVSKKREIRRSSASSVAAGYDVVVAVGGDDAVVQAAAGLARSQVALGVVPTGAGDLLAGNLGIPCPSLGRRPRHPDGSKASHRPRSSVDRRQAAQFRSGVRIGYDATVGDATDKPKKLPWGKAAYLANAVRQIGEIRNIPHQLTIDGETRIVDASQVFIANFGKLLPVIKPRQPVRPGDGRLDVIVVSASGFDPRASRELGSRAAEAAGNQRRRSRLSRPSDGRSPSRRRRLAWSRAMDESSAPLRSTFGSSRAHWPFSSLADDGSTVASPAAI